MTRQPYVHPKLKTRDLRNVERFYWAEVHNNPPRYYTFSQKTRDGNILRSSATYPRKQSLRTPIEQCHFEIAAIYKKRERLGWTHVVPQRSPPTRDLHRYYKPMLAQRYPHVRPVLPCYAQPKLDGVRAVGTKFGLWTRKNMAITSVPHITEALERLFAQRKDLEAVDGELYLHGWPLSKISGLARRDVMGVDSSKLEYHIFDAEFRSSQQPYETRLNMLGSMKLPETAPGMGKIIMVETEYVETQEDMDWLHERWTRQGYEGSMYRNRDLAYMHKRSYALIKRKDFQTAEYKLLDIREGNGAWRGVAKSFHYQTPAGKPFATGIRGTIAEMREILQHKKKYLDKPATVRYLYLDERSKIPQIPVTIELARSDK